MQERRRHVRAKPTPELPAHVLAEVSALITEPLDIVDISVGGLAIIQGMKTEAVGATMKVRLVLGGVSYPINGVVRWNAKGQMGLEFVDPPAETAQEIRRFIGELLERGG